MSISLPQRSISWGARTGRWPVWRRRTETAAHALARPESLSAQEWDERVAREVHLQGSIEAAFDRSDAHERLGDFAPALEWLDQASALSGGLSPTYTAEHARFVCELERGNR